MTAPSGGKHHARCKGLKIGNISPSVLLRMGSTESKRGVNRSVCAAGDGAGGGQEGAVSPPGAVGAVPGGRAGGARGAPRGARPAPARPRKPCQGISATRRPRGLVSERGQWPSPGASGTEGPFGGCALRSFKAVWKGWTGLDLQIPGAVGEAR